MSDLVLQSSIPSLLLLGRGKVRDNYAVSDAHMLIVTSDRLSAFDVVLNEAIPDKGKVLNQMSDFWFRKLAHIVPNHQTSIAAERIVDPAEVAHVAGRGTVVKRLKPILVEAVVRGYLAGSGWADYQEHGAICGVALPPGLRNAEKLPKPIFTPAAKSEMGTHDVNVSFAEVEKIIGSELATQMRDISIRLYSEAAEYALARGIVIADTKFEFGLDANGTLTLMDEVLTPDSSRFWLAETYCVGSNPPSFDKQFIRDYLETIRIDGQPWNKTAPAPLVPPDVIEKTAEKYREALTRLTGETLG